MTERHGIKPVEELTFADDFMFCTLMRDPGVCAGVIERLLGIKAGRIEYVEVQEVLRPAYEARGVRFDVYARDSDRVFDIEMQRREHADLPQRARYYQSILDTDLLLRGMPYSALPESMIIFICLGDPFGKGLPRYTFRSACDEETGLVLGDKTTKVFYNAKAYGRSRDKGLRALLRLLCENRADDGFTTDLLGRVRETIRSEMFRGEYLRMTLHDYDIRQEGLREGRLEGRLAGLAEGASSARQEAAWNLSRNGVAEDIIASSLGMTVDEVRKAAASPATDRE